MTKDQQAALEQAAQSFCEQYADEFLMQEARAALVTLLAAQRAAVLEEAAQLAETLGVHPQLNVYGGGPDWYRHGKDIAAKIRQQAQEQRP